ncbi:crossover junction endodeoxyribonuclease RusA [Paraburkholderia sp. BL8N3]|nr:RusA family crossover junction endodeoxyribonuclease [Paraburkholderia sp. BL8N3]TCK37993.1 crossover junction endodeoxyribonuclease RusA [Paraburkholderia sp. BL8N3]
MSTETIALALPYPVSANRYWRTYVVMGHAQTVVSAEANAYRREVAWRLKIAKVRNPIEGRVELSIVLHPKLPQDARLRMRKLGDAWDDDLTCIDLDNSLKILCDALKGRAFVDDRFIWRIHAERGEPTAQAYVEVFIKPIPYVQPQQPLFEHDITTTTTHDDPLAL